MLALPKFASFAALATLSVRVAYFLGIPCTVGTICAVSGSNV
jgi:hypothetical protein